MSHARLSTLSTTPSGPTGAERLSLDGAVLTRRTSLSLPERMPLEDWKRVGRQLTCINDSSTWWLGDWLVYGREVYPDRYRRAIEDTALDYQTLRNYAWIAGRFLKHRRRPALSFQHHAEVAALADHLQDMWLDRAEQHGWSRNTLRTHIRRDRGLVPMTITAVVQIRMDIAVEQKRLWQDAAERTHSELREWMVEVLNEAARREAAPEPAPLPVRQAG
ncbi:hypothetical protein SAMN05421505_13653 [Sinosporangium album]|uniref:Uncharacterized protein n=1 Tax=Sinosporangium album TaxID=504805 RepID=A0A1G8IDT2_9ACTN|nr:LmbU family transcriptional regulator [Sinosporangium album]SDI16710.1 hypothetical protein SAMN05421505_13653 [Sinosporangium album]